MKSALVAISFAGALMLSASAAAQYRVQPDRDPILPRILPLEQRAKVEDRWLKERLDTLVPMLMRRDGVDMWIQIAGE
jgi:hypothetical protein